jgi:two-component system cell cycle sensor histidine kinase PleC
MFRKLFPIIASITLITIFAILFNLSLPKIENFFSKGKITDISSPATEQFVKSLTDYERQLINSLPCKFSPEKCPNTDEIRKKILASFTADKVSRALILDESGIEVFSNRSLDVKYSNLVKQAKIDSFASIQDGSGDAARVISVQKISDIVGNNSLNNKYILTLINKSNISTLLYIIIIGVVLFIPILVVVLLFTRQMNRADSGSKKLSNENKDYLEQIETLKKENVQQSQFLANFTHELRTPLNSIIGFSGLLKDQTLGPLGNNEYLKYANDINTSGVHLLSLINDILDYSKSEVGKLKVNMTEVDIVKIIKQCLSILAPRASESKVDLLQSFANDYFILRLDPKRLKQILLNLLSNSVKFTPEGGSVAISAFPDIKGDKISIEVKDTGVGIAEKDIPTVMSLFGQVETDLNRKYEGTGIGLPFAKKLTTLMGGTFDLQSQVGVGTRITLTFPYDKKLNAEYAELYKKGSSGTE